MPPDTINADTAVAMTTQQPSILAIIERAARDPAIDVGKMRALFELKMLIERNDASKEFARAMADAQAEMPRVLKDGKNTENHSTYSKLETVQRAISPIYLRHGFSIVFDEPDPPNGKQICVRAIVQHSGGHAMTVKRYGAIDNVGMRGGANKTEIQGAQSAVSYLRRNMLLEIFGIIATGQDDDGNLGRGTSGGRGTITEEQRITLQDMIDGYKVNVTAFLRMCGIAQLTDLPAGTYRWAFDQLKRKDPAAPKAVQP